MVNHCDFDKSCTSKFYRITVARCSFVKLTVDPNMHSVSW